MYKIYLQVVSSICEAVEASFANIKSGWRPLFGALRAVRVYKQQLTNPDEETTDRTEHPLAPLFNVFEAFLNTDNVAVFANAAVDCILCLLKFLRGSGTMCFQTLSLWHEQIQTCFAAKIFLEVVQIHTFE